MMNPVNEEVERRLCEIERDHGVRVVYACESGSRAWGFESTDSDYDVRFLYLHDRSWYLSIDIETKRDVIETPIEGVWDVNGWDLRKALRLMRKSNPPLVEWLNSPIVYRERGPVADMLRAVLPDYFSPRAAMYHYLHMARGNLRSYLQGERVKQKRYFYVLRPILACRWLEMDLGVVPTEFGTLMEKTLTDPSLLGEIESLLVSKRAGKEVGLGPRIPEISEFLDSELVRFEENGVMREGVRSDVEPLSELFQRALQVTWA